MRKNLNQKQKELLTEIGMRLCKHREENHITQEQIAEHLNRTPITIHRQEYGKSIPDIIDLMNYCKVYQVSADEILFGQKKLLPEDTTYSKKILHHLIDKYL